LAEKLQDFENIIKKQLKDNEDFLRELSRREVLPKEKPTGENITDRPTEKVFSFDQVEIAVLVIACNRTEAVKNIIDQLLKYDFDT